MLSDPPGERGVLFGALASPGRPPHSSTSEKFSSGEVKFINGARSLRYTNSLVLAYFAFEAMAWGVVRLWGREAPV